PPPSAPAASRGPSVRPTPTSRPSPPGHRGLRSRGSHGFRPASRQGQFARGTMTSLAASFVRIAHPVSTTGPYEAATSISTGFGTCSRLWPRSPTALPGLLRIHQELLWPHSPNHQVSFLFCLGSNSFNSSQI